MMLKVAAEVGGAVEVAVRLMSSYDVVVDAVEQRARNLAHVVGALVLVVDAFLLGGRSTRTGTDSSKPPA